jgi:50S ribosomal protein L16 3-hydroxylase
MLHWPEGLDVERFLYEYWQKKPVFLPRAIPSFDSPLDPDEVAGLACEPGIESRIVMENSDPPWTLENGPFEPERFGRLPQTGWSLLVQDVDKHVPESNRVRAGFRFLPDWRFDDLMVSFAPPGGSVGPHVDAYDVFLVQGLGRRRWHVDPSPRSRRRIPGTPLDLLADFQAVHEWVAEPGDVLYLPPGAAHHGVALDHCITWSVGFRSPLAADVIAALADTATARAVRYADSDMVPEEAADGLIHDRAVARFRRWLEDAVLHESGCLRETLGCLLTEPKSWLHPPAPEAPVREPGLRDHLDAGGGLSKHPMSLMARSRRERGWTLFANGRALAVDPSLESVAAALCAESAWPAERVSDWLGRPGGSALILDLLADGTLELV